MSTEHLLTAVVAAAQEAEGAEDARDTAIRRAFAAGVNRQKIADAAGLSRARIYQIAEGAPMGQGGA